MNLNKAPQRLETKDYHNPDLNPPPFCERHESSMKWNTVGYAKIGDGSHGNWECLDCEAEADEEWNQMVDDSGNLNPDYTGGVFFTRGHYLDLLEGNSESW